MHHVKMLDELEDVARRAADRWYVTTGNKAVGPVNLDLLARGVEAGKVPLEAFVRHEGWKVWRPLAEVAFFLDGDEPSSRLTLVPGEPTDDIGDGGRPSTPSDFSPADLVDCSERREALVLLMTAAVARSGADAVIVHELEEDHAAAVCAHGPSRREALGMRTPRFDPAVVAAEAGITIVVEPVPGPSYGGVPCRGPAGASVVARLSRLACPIEGALLIPIRAGDRVTGMIEIGRRTPFHPAEVASLTALVDALAQRLDGGA